MPLAAIATLALAGACDDDGTSGSPSASSTSAGGSGGSGVGGAGGNAGGAGGTSSCHSTPRADNAARAVVVSHPYDANSGGASSFELLSLSPTGALTTTGTRFDMGRAVEGVVAFTPDAAVGLLAQEDGTLGVFAIDDGGTVSVVHASFDGSFYAGSVVMGPNGNYAYVLDVNFPNNGGGIYRVAIACDGMLTDEGMVTTTKLARRMVPLDDGQYLLAADEMLSSAAGADAHLITLEPTAITSSVDSFGDDAIVGSLAVTRDGRFGLIGDNSGFSVDPNSVAVVAISPSGLTSAQRLSPLNDPVSIVTSPFNDRAIVTSAFGDAIFELAYDPQNANAPFTLVGEVAYTSAPPQIPVDAVMITRGDLDGLVLVSEVSTVRQLQFRDGMPVAEVGSLDFGSGTENIVGAIGVQP